MRCYAKEVRHLMYTLLRLAACSFLILAGLPSAHGQLIIAHRGASHDAPENTLSAFKLAIEQGADGFEARLLPGQRRAYRLLARSRYSSAWPERSCWPRRRRSKSCARWMSEAGRGPSGKASGCRPWKRSWRPCRTGRKSTSSSSRAAKPWDRWPRFSRRRSSSPSKSS